MNLDPPRDPDTSHQKQWSDHPGIIGISLNLKLTEVPFLTAITCTMLNVAAFDVMGEMYLTVALVCP